MSTPAESTPKPVYNVKNPLIAKLKHRYTLTKENAAKDTQHYEIDLSGSGLEFLPGDSLAVLPTNDPALVDLLLKTVQLTGEEVVTNPKGAEVSLRQALTESYSLRDIDNKLLKAIAEKAGNSELLNLTAPDHKEALKNYLWGKDVIDIVASSAGVSFEAQELVGLLKKLNVRLYSISSSLKANPEQVHLTVATVEYESQGRKRGGVCSTWLAQRVDENTPIPVFITPGKGFRLPEPEEETPIIMVGPGTGIAPFRAFLQERQVTKAKGKAWLFFGEINKATCFFYQEEFESYLADGTLTKLDTAFSRDQETKLYVQHKLLENAKEIYEWLEQGAIFYVCGDAARMATDVDNALREIIAQEGGKSPEEVNAYMEEFKKAKRYRRDVY